MKDNSMILIAIISRQRKEAEARKSIDNQPRTIFPLVQLTNEVAPKASLPRFQPIKLKRNQRQLFRKKAILITGILALHLLVILEQI